MKKRYTHPESVPDWYCEHCGNDFRQVPEETYENSDMDGNRGQWMKTVICPECGEEWSVV